TAVSRASASSQPTECPPTSCEADMQLRNRKAIVLGGTSGIGLAAVQQLIAKNATVIAGSRKQRELPKGATFAPIDVLDRAALAALFAAHAPFDILVNAATGGERATGPFARMELDGFQGSFRKLWGYANSVRLGLEHMTEHGAIVLVSGTPARKSPPGMSAISTVGNAVEGFARAIAPEIAPRRINVVAPGLIDTPMFAMQGEPRANFLATATAN